MPFTGALAPAVSAQLQRADVFALPVRTRLAGLDPEGLGLAALEASACGLPVVVGRSGGAPETVGTAAPGISSIRDDPYELATDSPTCSPIPARAASWVPPVGGVRRRALRRAGPARTAAGRRYCVVETRVGRPLGKGDPGGRPDQGQHRDRGLARGGDGGDRRCRVLSRSGSRDEAGRRRDHPPDGKPDHVKIKLEHSVVSDHYTLAYGWLADSVSWNLVEGQLLKAMDGRTSCAVRPGHQGHLRPVGRRPDADDRDVPAQGREDDHRRRAEGPQAAGGGLTPPGSAAPGRRRPPLPASGSTSAGPRSRPGWWTAGARSPSGCSVPTPSHSPQAVEDAIVDLVTQLRPARRGRVGRDRCRRLGRQHPVDRPVLAAPGLARGAAEGPAARAHRSAADRRQRRERRRLVRVPVRRRTGSSVMVCITLGTGIGGGLVINGELFRGTYGMAASGAT